MHAHPHGKPRIGQAKYCKVKLAQVTDFSFINGHTKLNDRKRHCHESPGDRGIVVEQIPSIPVWSGLDPGSIPGGRILLFPLYGFAPLPVSFSQL